MDWSTIRTYPNEAEASLALAVLEAGEVPARLARKAGSALTFGVSAFAVEVPTMQLSEANELLGSSQNTATESTPSRPASSLSLVDRMRYTEALADIRARRRLVWVLFLGYLPAVTVLTPLLKSVAHPRDPGFVAAIGWMVLFAMAGFRVTRARCPRCAKRFHAAALWQNPWTSRCLHCGLHVKADENAA
jgi:hypothetical protein